MRRSLTTIVTVVSSVALVLPSAAQALQASAPALSDRENTPIVTKAEYAKIHKKTNLNRVHKVFGTAGKQMTFNPGDPLVNQPALQSREYRTGSKYGFVSVYYKKVDGAWIVRRKAAYWG